MRSISTGMMMISVSLAAVARGQDAGATSTPTTQDGSGYTAPAGDSGTITPPAPENVERTWVGPNGQTHTYERTVNGDTVEIQQTMTGPKGQTRTMDRTITPDGTDMKSSFVGPNGQTRTYERTVNGDTIHIQQTMTNPNGQTRTIDRTITLDSSTTNPATAGGQTPLATTTTSTPVTQTTAAAAAPATTTTSSPRHSGFTMGASSKAWANAHLKHDRSSGTVHVNNGTHGGRR